MNRAAIGIDVGGTKIGGAVVAESGAVLYREAVSSPRGPHGVDPGAAETMALLERLEARAAQAGLGLRGAGIGVPEYVTPDGRIASRLVLAPDADLPATTRSGMPIVIDSDVRCAARAEHRLGHGRRFGSFVFASIGTGISHTLVVDGRIWPGHRGEAIALGEMPVDQRLVIRPDAPATVEQQASGRALEQAAASGTGDDIRTRDIRTRDIVTRAGEIVARALADLVLLVDPAAVVIGGGLGSSRGPYTEALARQFSHLTRRRPAAPALLQARLGNDAGAIGVGLLVHQPSG